MTKKYIDANALYDTIDELDRYDDFEDVIIVGDALQAIMDAPAVDIQNVRHGKWIKVPSATHRDLYWYDCSICKASYGERSYKGLFELIEWNGGQTLYCSNCGSKMDGGVI